MDNYITSLDKSKPSNHTESFTRYKNQGQAGAMFSDFGTAFGSFNVTAVGTFNIKVDEKGNVAVTGRITYTFGDTYKWHSGRGDKGDLEFVSHSTVNGLKGNGFEAKDFSVRVYYYQDYQSVNWSSTLSDINDSPKSEQSQHSAPQDGGRNYYQIPASSELINDYGAK